MRSGIQAVISTQECAGFLEKEKLLKSKLKRNPTWEEVLWDCRGSLKSKKPEDVIARELVSKHLADLEKGVK